MIEKLKALNIALIKENENNEAELKKQLIIKKILENNRCFFEMDIETAYSILKDLKIPNDSIKSLYCSLIDINNYQ